MKLRGVQLVLLLAVATVDQTSALNGCPTGMIPVSVLENPEVKCVQARPCSGVYGSNGVEPIGECPAGDACALLPSNHAVMGCVAAGRTDVTYVNPDGSLSPGPYSPPPINTPAPATSTPTTTSKTGSATGSHAGSRTGSRTSSHAGSHTGSRATGSQASGSKATGSRVHSKNGSKSGSGFGHSSSGSLVDTQTKSGSNNGQGPNGINQDKVNGPGKHSNDTSNKSGGMSLTSILLIVIGCLAVVAVVAGVRLLQKRKEPAAAGAAAIGAADYDGGAECMTPKERVLLL